MQSNTNTQSSPAQPSPSLRERCGIKFRLALSPPYFKSTQPTYDTIPRRRKRTSAPAAAVPPPLSPTDTPSSSFKPGKLGSHLKQFLRRRREEDIELLARRRECEYLAQFPPVPDFDLDDLLATPITPRFAERDESRCLQQIIPGCYVAFEDDNTAWFGSTSKDALATPHGRNWTHVVSISHQQAMYPASSPSSSEGTPSECSDDSVSPTSTCSSDTYDEAVQTLRLVLPPAPDVVAEDEDPMCTVLTDDQLVSARDFLSFHGHSLNWRGSVQGHDMSSRSSSTSGLSSSSSTLAEEDEPVRLLITGPRNRRADTLSVALCYLAFAFDTRVETFLRELQSRKGCLPVWRNVLNVEGVATINRAAVVSTI